MSENETIVTDRMFEEMVDDDLRGKLPKEKAELLRSAQWATKWRDTLKSIKRSVESSLTINELNTRIKYSLTNKASEQEAILQNQNEWRKKAISFRRCVEDALAESKEVVKKHTKEATKELTSRDLLFEILEELKVQSIHMQNLEAYLKTIAEK